MKDYLDIINKNHEIRRKTEDKRKFQEFALNEATKAGISARVEALEEKHENIIFGDPDGARVVFTAHYDTPAASLVPNLMMPRNPILSAIYQFSYPFILALLALGAAYGITALSGLPYETTIILYLVLYLSSYYLLTRTFDNKHNANDNTSGTAVILSLLSKANSDKVAFILFDDEERGTLGSKAFSKAHEKSFSDKLVVNLDCVGNGSNILTVAKSKAMLTKEYPLLKECLRSNGIYTVEHYSTKGSASNSDHKNFACGMSVMACKRNSVVGFYTPRIHTKHDTEASSENIEFISDRLAEFANQIND